MSETRKNIWRSTRSRAQRLIKRTRPAGMLKSRYGRPSTATLWGGAVVVATAAAATGAVLMRRPLGRLALATMAEARSASDSVEALGHRMARTVRREMKHADFARFLAYAGIKRRPSLMSRLLAPTAALAAVAAAGTALFVVAPKLFAAGQRAPASEPATTSSSAPAMDGAGEPGLAQASNGMRNEGTKAVSDATK